MEVDMNQLQSGIIKGALAGVAGTAAMTLMMRGMAPKMVPQDMRPPEFLPKAVVEAGEKQFRHPNALAGHEWQAAYAAHFAYGAGLGAVYGVAREGLPQLPAPVTGVLFGVSVWAFGFQTLLPELGVQPKASEQPMKRRPMPIMAHVVFGVATALAYETRH
jgi:putative membrane protein